MSLASNLSNAFTRIATELKSVRTQVNGNSVDLSSLSTATKSNLVAAINEVKQVADNAATSGGASSLDQLADVAVATPAAGHVLRHDGTQFVNVLGTTHYEAAGAAAAAQAAAIAASQPLDTDLTAISALATTTFGRNLLTMADAAALTGQISSASETVQGKIELATQAEVNTGTDTARAVTPATLQSRLTAYAQPVDSDLTSIAALTTTAFGRGLLTLADSAALTASVAAATDAIAGKVELATTTEASTGTDTARAVTPAGVKAAIDSRTSSATDLGGASASTTVSPSQSAVKAYADALIGANDAMVFRGALDASTNPNYPAANRGDTYRVSVAGRLGGAAGPVVEVGDIAIAITDATAAGTHATVGANWTIVQTNIDGAVTGPTSSVSGNLASFSGTSGSVVADSGVAIDIDGTLAANSDTRLATQKAVRTYAQPKDSELTAIAGLTSAADRMPYFTGAGTASLATFTAFGRSLVDDADAAAARTTLGLGTAATAASTAFQPSDATLTALAGLTTAANQMIYATGADTFATTSLTAFGRSLIDDADAATARTTLDVYSKAEIGNPETDFVAVFEAGLV